MRDTRPDYPRYRWHIRSDDVEVTIQGQVEYVAEIGVAETDETIGYVHDADIAKAICDLHNRSLHDPADASSEHCGACRHHESTVGPLSATDLGLRCDECWEGGR